MDWFTMRGRKMIKLNLNVGDMVVGLHAENGGTLLRVIAGKINRKITEKDSGMVIYNVTGKSLQQFDKTINFTGSLDENEIEVIDQDKCHEIIELYEFANKQIIQKSPDRWSTIEKVNKMRETSRMELEDKYAVVEI
jgi:hypothetical protein